MGATEEDRRGTSKVPAPVSEYAADGQGVVGGATSRQHRAAAWKGVLGGGHGQAPCPEPERATPLASTQAGG